eukprot:6180908-Pleurochrysis_carterae.AAC.5
MAGAPAAARTIDAACSAHTALPVPCPLPILRQIGSHAAKHAVLLLGVRTTVLIYIGFSTASLTEFQHEK